MSPEELLRAARDQLNLILTFFARVETKLSVVLGVDLAMLGFLASRFPGTAAVDDVGWIAAAAFVVLNAVSLINLYIASAPQLDGGHGSLVYFKEIAKRTELAFADEFTGLSTKTLARDVLGQVWRNSQILKVKFDRLVWAYRCMAFAILPWIVALVLFVA